MGARTRMKTRQRTKRQHFVAQLYLRRFADASGRLFCFDKVRGTSHPTSTAAAAQEANFYEIASGSFESGVEAPVNVVENALASIERMWGPRHGELLRCAEAGAVPAALKQEYSIFVVFQWMRTRSYRDAIHAVMQQYMQSIVNDLVDLNFPDHDKVTVHVGTNTLAAIHAQKMFDLDEMEKMAWQVQRLLWVIGVNGTSHPFYTSDHPVVRRGNVRVNGRSGVGILDPGVEYAFPLDSRHILLMFERTHFAAWLEHENRSVVLSPEQVRDYNSLQVMRSNQRVFCADDDFGVASDVCRAHPEVCNPDRPRVVVESTPVRNMKNYTFVTALE